MKVKKRDGSIVNFDESKISNAIGAANKAVSKPERATAREKKENEKNGSLSDEFPITNMFLKTAAFFTLDQVERV